MVGQIRQEGFGVEGEEDCLKYLGGGIEKKGGDRKILKRGDKLARLWVKGWVP